MATVYLAEDLKHDRKVAVKVLRPVLAAVLGGDRFNREIHIAAQLQHPHILPLLDSGDADGFLYYVMPYVQGESLRERLAKHGELPVHDAVRLLTEVVDALAHAHGHGVVHRDIKPDNVLLSGRHALVSDFGVAKAVSEASGRQKLTTTGVALGTPAYMAPEQAAADPHQDHRVDIYAIGCLGYELLCGRPPFTGMTPQEVLAAHVTQSPEPVERHRRAVPPSLSAVVMRCLAKRPADRWQTADELLTELEALATPSGGVTPTQTRPLESVARATQGSRRWLFPLGMVAGIAAVAVLASRFSRPGAPDVRLGRRIQATLSPGLEVFPALSPKGDLLAYTAGADNRLYVRQVDGGAPIPVARELAGFQVWPHWSPDGKRLSFTSARGVEIVPALGGTPRLLLATGKSRLGFNASAWSPDGRELLVVQSDTLHATPVEGGPPRTLTTGSELHSCSWAPTGTWIACVSGNRPAIQPGVAFANLAQSAIVLVPVTGGQLTPATTDSSANSSPCWLPDGTLVFVSDRGGGRDLYALRLNRKGKPGSPYRLTTGLNALGVTVSNDGTRIGYAVFTETSNVWSLPVSSRRVGQVSQAEQITSGNQVIENFDISPDGLWLAFDSDRSGNTDLYRTRLDGSGEPEQLTRSPVNEFFPVWSPDGTELAFHSFREGRRQIYIMPSEGGAAVPVVRTEQDDRVPIWLPEGNSIVFMSNATSASNEARIVTRSPDGSWRPPTRWKKPACVPVWSQDVTRAVCITTPGQLVLTDRKGDSLRVLTDRLSVSGTMRSAGWSSSGEKVYFLSADSTGVNVYVVPASGGLARIAVRFDDPARPWHRYGFQIFRDRFYFTVGDRQSDIWVTEVERP